MRTAYFGPFEVDINKLPEAELAHSKEEWRRELKESIKKVGLLNALDLLWDLRDNKFVIAKGNQRLAVLRDLGEKKVTCYVRIYVYDGQEGIIRNMRKFLPYVGDASGECVKTAVPYK